MTSEKKKSFPPEILALDEQFGEFMEYWGFKRIHGRVWLHLFLSEAPLDVAELMRRLRVSKTLMSFCIRDMREYSVIIEDGIAKHGTVLYRANPDLYSVVRNVLRTRERPLLARIKSAQQLALSISDPELTDNGISGKKIRDLGKLVNSADRSLQGLIRLSAAIDSGGVSLLEMLAKMGGRGTD